MSFHGPRSVSRRCANASALARSAEPLHACTSIRVSRRVVCIKLGLKRQQCPAQIIQHDRAEFVTVLGHVACSVDRWATSFAICSEPRCSKLKSISPQARRAARRCRTNAIQLPRERLCGLARVIRGNVAAALENVALWHERDISHGSVERIILPDSCTLLDYMLVTLRKLVESLHVYPEHMRRNMEITRGLYASQSALLMLTEKGLDRKEAYEAVQRAAMKTWKGGSFAENLAGESTVASWLTKRDIARACSLSHFPGTSQTELTIRHRRVIRHLTLKSDDNDCNQW